MVAAATGRLRRAVDIRRLRHVGGVPERPLHLTVRTLSPFYSPELFGSPHAWFGPKPAFLPAWLPFSPALVILPIPAFFRVTCYYYRGAYYKAFWGDPPSCTVGEPRKTYWGENSFPLILQNIHRYMLFLSMAVLAVLYFDVWKALWFTNPQTGLRGVRHRRRHARAGGQRRAADRGICSAVTRCGTSARRLRRRTVVPRRWGCAPTTASASQSQAHAVGVDEPRRRRLSDALRAALLDGRVDGLSNSVVDR